MSKPKAYDPQQGYRYQLFFRLNGREWEHLDYARDRADLKMLVTEYNLAYAGSGAEIKSMPLPQKYWARPAPFPGETLMNHRLNDAINREQADRKASDVPVEPSGDAVSHSPLQISVRAQAQAAGIDMDLLDAADHKATCNCEKCFKYWVKFGNNVDGFGPFTRAEIETERWK